MKKVNRATRSGDIELSPSNPMVSRRLKVGRISRHWKMLGGISLLERPRRFPGLFAIRKNRVSSRSVTITPARSAQRDWLALAGRTLKQRTLGHWGLRTTVQTNSPI